MSSVLYFKAFEAFAQFRFQESQHLHLVHKGMLAVSTCWACIEHITNHGAWNFWLLAERKAVRSAIDQESDVLAECISVIICWRPVLDFQTGSRRHSKRSKEAKKKMAKQLFFKEAEEGSVRLKNLCLKEKENRKLVKLIKSKENV